MSYIRPPFVLLYLLVLGWNLWADGSSDSAFADANPRGPSPRAVLR